jgi:hypothetical protein
LNWTEQVIKKMGVVSDAELAKELGCSTTLVALKRNELQIPAYPGGTKTKPKKTKPKEK